MIFKVATMSKYNILFKCKFNLTLAGFFSLANYSLVRLTSKKIIKVVKDCKYLISTPILPETSLDLFHIAQIAKFLPDNDTISYIICLTNTIYKANIDWFSMKCKQVICNVLATKVYTRAYGLNIEKQY